MKRIGHKGADALAPGNTLEGFRAAVELGVDMIELDVLELADGRVVIAHDLEDAAGREPLTFEGCLDAFEHPPLDRVELDFDLKTFHTGELVAGELRRRGLLERSMLSGLDLPTVEQMRDHEADLRLGWTYPEARRPWMESRWAMPVVGTGVAVLRRRLPGALVREAPRRGLQAVWPHWQLVTRRLVEAAEGVGVSVFAWTVDDAERIRALRDLGVHGVCTNDPRLFDGLG